MSGLYHPQPHTPHLRPWTLLYYCWPAKIVQSNMYPPAFCTPCLFSITTIKCVCSKMRKGNIDPYPLRDVIMFMKVVTGPSCHNVRVIIRQDNEYCNSKDPAYKCHHIRGKPHWKYLQKKNVFHHFIICGVFNSY